MSHPAWIETSRIRERLRAAWQGLLGKTDVELCPPLPTSAFPHDHASWLTRTLDIDGRMIPYQEQIAWAAVATMCGLPATVAPIGRSETGLPIGVQLISGYLQDLTTIALTGMIEREFGGFSPPPDLA
jgi:amidase